jgi:hypothetical protein
MLSSNRTQGKSETPQALICVTKLVPSLIKQPSSQTVTVDINSNVNDNVNDIPIPKPKAPSPQSAPTAVEQLLQLDAARRPGLTAFDFQTLFTRCECGTITTKEVFHLHHCRKRRRLNTDEEIQLAEITQAAACPFKQLMLLNCSNRPGLTDVRFQALFVRCTCGIITTQSAFKDHYCIVKTWQRT